MSLLCVDAVRRRVIPLWLGVMVAVWVASARLRAASDFSTRSGVQVSACELSPKAIWSRTLIWQ